MAGPERLISGDSGKETDRTEGGLICCRHCGCFIIRRSSRNGYCNRTECQKARNARNQDGFREQRRKKKAREKE